MCLSFSGLREKNRFNRGSNIACIIHMKSRASRTWKEIGRTELLENTLDPEWSKAFLLDYYFEEKQVSEFSIHSFTFNGKTVSRDSCLLMNHFESNKMSQFAASKN